MDSPKVDLRLPSRKDTAVPAPVWKRVASFVFDLAVILFIISPFTSVIGQDMVSDTDFYANFERLSSSPELYSRMSFVSVSVSLLMLAYFVMFEMRLRQTPGKMLFRLVLVPAEKKEGLTFWRILLRNLAAVPVSLLSLLLIIDPIYLFATGRRLSDILSKSFIAEERTK